MNKIHEIFDGWKNLIFQSPEHEELAIKRIEICVKCPKFTKTNRCSLCGCYMPAKVRSQKKQTSCPLKKW